MEDKQFFKTIIQEYGMQTKKDMQFTLKLTKKLARQRSRKNFLLQCRRYSLIPKSLNMNLKGFKHCVSSKVIHNLTRRFSGTILNESIKQLFGSIKFNQKLSNDNASGLTKVLSKEHFKDFKDHVKASYTKEFNENSASLKVKFEKLINPSERKLSNCNDKWLKNLTKNVIPPNVAAILALDKKFNLPSSNKYIHTEQIITNLEPVFQTFGAKERVRMRNKLVNSITNYKNTPCKETKEEKIIKKKFIETKLFLKENPNIYVMKADKGNVTVLINKEDYHKKMMDMLNDEKTYTKNKFSLTYTIESLVKKSVKDWQLNNYVTEETADSLTTTNAICAKAYLQIKIHKKGNPARMIVDSIGCPTYKLAKWYCSILKNVVGKTKHSIRNAEDFINKLKDVKVPPGYEMISLDVISLFTNIDKELVYEAVNERWTEIRCHTLIPKQRFLEGLKIILENCIFQYNEEFFKQLFGSPMGSPVSPVIADLVLEILQATVLKKIKYKVPCFFRFVDDCFAIVPKDKKEHFKRMFNSYNEHLQFTLDEETDGALAFLDTKVIRNEDGNITTDWYHKDTWSGRYLNFHSNLPMSYKRNTVSILTSKILKLSDVRFHEKNFELLYTTLTENGYRQNFIKSIVNRTIEKLKSQSDSAKRESQKFVSIPYAKGLFESIKSIFKDTDVKIVGKGANTLMSNIYTRLKDVTPLLDQSGLIYKVMCECGLCYVGQTIQKLRKRIYDHKYNISIGNKSHSALCEHVINTKHKVLWDTVQVIGKENFQDRRNILEMIKIKKTPNNVNLQTDSMMLPSAYFSIM